MPLTVDLETARTACAESVEAFVRAVEPVPELALLAPSRCVGWSRLDVVVHVLLGWQEMLGGFVSPTDAAPTVDAATYWGAFAEEFVADDPIPALMAQRRRTAAYARPSSALEQLRDVAASLQRGIAGLPDRALTWQGFVFTAGDFLAIWAVEDVLHQLDLLLPEPAPASALRLTRLTVEAIAGPLPQTWDDVQAALVGAGRLAVPDDAAHLGYRLPALG